MRILVAEDDPVASKILRLRLGSGGSGEGLKPKLKSKHKYAEIIGD